MGKCECDLTGENWSADFTLEIRGVSESDEPCEALSAESPPAIERTCTEPQRNCDR